MRASAVSDDDDSIAHLSGPRRSVRRRQAFVVGMGRDHNKAAASPAAHSETKRGSHAPLEELARGQFSRSQSATAASC